MSRPFRVLLLASGVVLLASGSAEAGMPTVSLSDVARMRLQSISFFGAGVLLSAWIVQGLWNVLQQDFTKLPRLSYRASLAGTLLWGLLFLFVLTMISGARELMTPGAWEKDGFTYRLAEEIEAEAGVSAGPTLEERHEALGELRSALWLHAATHEGRFPENPEEAQFADEFWIQPGFSAVRYGYQPGLSTAEAAELLAFEHAVYADGSQLALFVDGSIREQVDGELEEMGTTERTEGTEEETRGGASADSRGAPVEPEGVTDFSAFRLHRGTPE